MNPYDVETETYLIGCGHQKYMVVNSQYEDNKLYNSEKEAMEVAIDRCEGTGLDFYVAKIVADVTYPRETIPRPSITHYTW